MIYSGGRLRAEIPDLDLATFVLQRAGELGDKPALIDGISGHTLTYAELERSVRSFAAGLAERGFAKGDTFAIYMPNAPEYAVAFLGASQPAAVTTADPPTRAAGSSPQLADSGARMVLTTAPFLERGARGGGAHGELRGIRARGRRSGSGVLLSLARRPSAGA